MMVYEPILVHLEAAAQATRQRIQNDRVAAPPKLKPLLSYLEEHLFDTHLQVSAVMRACGVRDHSVSCLFHQAVGQTMQRYIEDCRLQVATELLAATHHRVSEIAHVLGYASLQSFSLAFRRWSGASPTVFRRQQHSRQLAARQPAETFDLSSRQLRRALFGTLDRAAADRLLVTLNDLYPGTLEPSHGHGYRQAPSEAIDLEGTRAEAAERRAAEELWRIMSTQDPIARRSLLSSGAGFKTPILFHVLRKKSLEVGREDRRKGIAVAELALESLIAYELGKFPDGPTVREMAHLKALGWITLGNAKRLALELEGAEEAIQNAEDLISGLTTDPKLQATFLDNKAALYNFQNRLTSASLLQDRAVKLRRSLDDPDCLAKSLMIRAQLSYRQGEFEDTICDLREAKALLSHDRHWTLYFAANYNLTKILIRSSRTTEARQLYKETQALVDGRSTAATEAMLLWQRALLLRSQNRLDIALDTLREALSILESMNEQTDVALIHLDIAHLYLQKGQTDQGIQHALESYILHTSLDASTEKMAALSILKKAIESKTLTAEILTDSQSLIERSSAFPNNL